MLEALCGARVKERSARANVLRTRRDILNEEINQTELTCASQEECAALRDRVNETIAEGSPAILNTLLQALIHEIRGEPVTPSSPSFACLWRATPWRTLRFAHRSDRWR